MKSIRNALLLGLAALLGSGSAQSQSLTASVKVGAVASTFSGEADSDFGLRGGLAAGAAVAVNLNNHFFVRPELLYVVKGAKSDNPIINGVPSTLEATFSIGYAEIPVLAGYRIIPDRSPYPVVFAGPAVSFRLSSRLRAVDKRGGGSIDQSDKSIQDVDFGIVGGAGVGFDGLGEKVLIDIRTNIGLSDIRGRPDAPLRNTAFLLTVGLTF